MTTPKRWQATIASALCMAAGMSSIFMGSFPVFLEPVSTSLGWGRATFPQVITIISLSAALLMPVGGRLVDRTGVRWPVAGGLALLAVGLLLLSFLADAGPLFWAAALCIGAGSALSGPPAFVALISSWYERNRALALGFIISVAPACGGALVSPLTQKLISEWGWRDAYRALAAIVVIAALIAVAGFLRPRGDASASPARGAPSASTGEALRTFTFWLLALGSSLGSATVIALTVHIVAWQTGRGVAPETAALVLSALFIASMAGAFLAGYAADRAGSIHILQVFYALPLAGLGIMAASIAVPALLLGAIFLGVAMGATTGLAPFLTTRYFGLKAAAEIFGIILAITMAALGLLPLLIGIGYDVTGSYTLPFTAAALVIVAATTCIGLLDYSARFRRPSTSMADGSVSAEE